MRAEKWFLSVSVLVFLLSGILFVLELGNLFYLSSVNSYLTYAQLVEGFKFNNVLGVLLVVCIGLSCILLLLGFILRQRPILIVLTAVIILIDMGYVAALVFVPDYLKYSYISKANEMGSIDKESYIHQYQDIERGLFVGYIVGARREKLLFVDIDDGKWIIDTKNVVKESLGNYGKKGQCVRVLGQKTGDGFIGASLLLPCPYEYIPSWVKRPICELKK